MEAVFRSSLGSQDVQQSTLLDNKTPEPFPPTTKETGVEQMPTASKGVATDSSWNLPWHESTWLKGKLAVQTDQRDLHSVGLDLPKFKSIEREERTREGMGAHGCTIIHQGFYELCL